MMMTPTKAAALCLAALLAAALAPASASSRGLAQQAPDAGGLPEATCPSNPDELKLELGEVTEVCGGCQGAVGCVGVGSCCGCHCPRRN